MCRHYVRSIIVLVHGHERRLHDDKPVRIQYFVGIIRDFEILVSVVLGSVRLETTGEEYLFDYEIV